MKRRRGILSFVLFLIAASSLLWAIHTTPVLSDDAKPADAKTDNAPAADSQMAVSFRTTVLPLLQENCYQCHANGNKKGDFTLDAFKSIADVSKDPDSWQLILDKVRKTEMPPPTAKSQLTGGQRDLLVAWIAKQIYQYDPKNPDPGRVTIHRLNRAEYNNTIRDLVGVNFQPADDFPSDDSGYGFDNIGDVLSVPPVLMEKYLAASTHIIDDAIVTEPLTSQVRHYNANLMEMGFNADGDRGDGWMPLGALEEDGVATALPVEAGDYIVRVHAFVQTRGGGGGPPAGTGRAGRAGAGGRAGGTTQPGAATQPGVLLGNGINEDIVVDPNAPQGPLVQGPAAQGNAGRRGRGQAGAAQDAAGADAGQAAVDPGGAAQGANGAAGAGVAGQGAAGQGAAGQGAAGARAGAAGAGRAGAGQGPGRVARGAGRGVLAGGGGGAGGGPPTPAVPANGLQLALMIDKSVAYDWDVTATETDPGTYEYRVGIPAGKHRFAVVNRRLRGGSNELNMENGRIGKKQNGTIWVKWVEIEGPLPNAVKRYPASTLTVTGPGKDLPTGGRELTGYGEVTTKINVPKLSDYILRVQAYADQAGSETTQMNFRLNGQTIKSFDVVAPATMIPIEGQRVFSTELLKPMPYVYELPIQLQPGEQTFSVSFANDFADPTNPNPNLVKRNLYIDYVEVAALSEPASLPEMPMALKKNFTIDPTPATKTEAAREILNNFARRAYRRPVQPAEMDGLMALFDKGDKANEPFMEAIKLPMKAVLVSPAFLFRGEIQTSPNDPKSVHPIDEYSLASRLSYFIWSSMPDDELLNLADQGQLRSHLQEQVKRMLTSPKSEALVENFAGQWLQFRNLKFVAPDMDTYPDYDPGIRDAMQTETMLFFNAVMREDRNVMDFVNGDFTYINGALANYYGIPGVKGDDFQRVSLEGTPRRGILTQGSVLTITSNPTRTSPVKRGKWVLENILGAPPPPPPPDVPELKNDGHPTTGTLRQQMEEHRANPTCASCHAPMDPLGFGLEQFDGIGKFREKDGDSVVDSSGQLVTGEKFNGAVELLNILATKKQDDFLNCLSEKMLTYATGRGMEYYDRPAIEQVVAGMKQNDLKFSSLIMSVVQSLPFQETRGEGTGPK